MSSSTYSKILVLCTLSTGLDTVLEVNRMGIHIEAIVGLNPQHVDLEKISGFVDIKNFANKVNVPCLYVDTYSLKSDVDKLKFNAINFDVIW